MSAPAAPAVPHSLRSRVLRAGGWSLAGFAVSQGLRFGTNLVMTRLLMPEMYGVMSIATLCMMALALFTDLGIRINVIQNARGGEPGFLNTIWVTKIVLGFAVFGATAVLAGVLLAAQGLGLLSGATAYASPELPFVLMALGAGAAIHGFESTRALEAARHLALALLTKLQLLAQVAGLIAMVLLAQHERSVWVLVAGSLVATSTMTLLTHLFMPGVPNRLRWDRDAFREIVRFGKWVLASSMVGFAGSAIDKALLGALVDASVLGVYSIAALLFYAIEQVFSKLTSEVTFPTLSEVSRDRRHDLRAIIYKFHTPLAFAVYGCAGFLFAAGPGIVQVLYDPRYWDAGWMLQILAFSLFVVPTRVHAACLLALGHSKLQFAQSLAVLVTTAVAVPAGFQLHGLTGAICGMVLGQLSAGPIALYFSAKLGTFDLAREAMPVFALPLGLLAGYLVFLVA